MPSASCRPSRATTSCAASSKPSRPKTEKDKNGKNRRFARRFFLLLFRLDKANETLYNTNAKGPGVAQFGRVLEWGSRGHEFKSRHSDQKKEDHICGLLFLFIHHEIPTGGRNAARRFERKQSGGLFSPTRACRRLSRRANLVTRTRKKSRNLMISGLFYYFLRKNEKSKNRISNTFSNASLKNSGNPEHLRDPFSALRPDVRRYLPWF